MRILFRYVYLERGIALGAAAFLIGILLLIATLYHWCAIHFGHLDYRNTMLQVVPEVTLAELGYQTILSSFLVSMLGMRRR
jgi:hypothetical protein